MGPRSWPWSDRFGVGDATGKPESLPVPPKSGLRSRKENGRGGLLRARGSHLVGGRSVLGVDLDVDFVLVLVMTLALLALPVVVVLVLDLDLDVDVVGPAVVL